MRYRVAIAVESMARGVRQLRAEYAAVFRGQWWRLTDNSIELSQSFRLRKLPMSLHAPSKNDHRQHARVPGAEAAIAAVSALDRQFLGGPAEGHGELGRGIADGVVWDAHRSCSGAFLLAGTHARGRAVERPCPADAPLPPATCQALQLRSTAGPVRPGTGSCLPGTTPTRPPSTEALPGSTTAPLPPSLRSTRTGLSRSASTTTGSPSPRPSTTSQPAGSNTGTR